MTKRKIKNNGAGDSGEPPRRSGRLSSKPLQNQTKEPEKREVLKRLFVRDPTVNIENTPPQAEPDDSDDENDDPLLSNVPANMIPVQFGFLVGAQETLRFLHSSGIKPNDPLFRHLRSHLLRGIREIGAA